MRWSGKGQTRIRRDTLLILDLSDLVKPYAKKMEYLSRVRDGSEGKLWGEPPGKNHRDIGRTTGTLVLKQLPNV
jgi:hypothetical protein